MLNQIYNALHSTAKRSFIVLIFITFGASAMAANVELNTANQTQLDGLSGLGPTKSKVILAARANGGEFKDWADFEIRVKGIKEKMAIRLSQAGLTVNGQSRPTTTSPKTP